MKTARNGFVFAALLSLTACSGGEPSTPASAESVAEETAGSTGQAVTAFDCQRQVTQCTQAARSLGDIIRCTAGFGTCATQAAVDLVGQGTLLQDCRAESSACLEGALTLSDVTACRNVYDACSGDVEETVTAVVDTAVGTAEQAIQIAAGIALDTIGAAAGLASGAIDAVEACQAQADQCLTGVATVSNVTACRDVFDECVAGAVALVDDIVEPLPGPTPTEVIEGFADCQASSEACLAGAVTATDLTACQATLETCVGDATALIDQTVDEVNQLLPLPLPSPTQPIDCTVQATECLLSLGNPITCAEQATQCLIP